jgi:hypothetical protein
VSDGLITATLIAGIYRHKRQNRGLDTLGAALQRGVLYLVESM